MTALRCPAITKGGNRCTVPVVRGLTHCFVHAPELREVRQETARRGGRASSAKARAVKALPEAMDAPALVAWLSAVFLGVMQGTMEPKVGTACATIARTLLEALAVAQQPTLDDLGEQVGTLRLLVERRTHGPVA